MMQGVAIEPVHAEAIDEIMSVMGTAFDPEFGEAWNASQCLSMFSLPGSGAIIARADGKACGFALIRTVLDEAELLMIAVGEHWQGKGIGRSILQSVVELAVTENVRKLHLEVREDNLAARHLYESDTFTVTGRRSAYYRGASGRISDSITLCRNIP
jgi:[ribosomal protein S18]-alanine N-acetyltransferase